MIPSINELLTFYSRVFRQNGLISVYFACLLLFFSVIFFPVSAANAPRHRNEEFVLRNVFQHKDQCYKSSFVWIPERNEQQSAAFSIVSATKQCADQLREANLPAKLPNCPPDLANLIITPAYVSKSQISYPYANLNISVTAHSSVQTIAFRLECLSASDGTDLYCSDSKAMYIGGVKEWPCRAMSLSSSVEFPARFSYACFRLTPHSVYAINATILPQKCRLSTILTAPSFDELFPDALVNPSRPSDLHSDPFWAPTLSVDLSDASGIWIHLGKAPAAQCDKLLINVYKEYSNDSSRVSFLETLEVKCPETAVKWENQRAGKYLLTAYVPIRGCKFLCDSADKHCRQCLRTHLSLEIRENRASFIWLALHTMKDHSYEIFIISAVLVGLIMLVMCMGMVYALWKQRRDAKRVQEIQLTMYVKAMLIYADDCVEHRNCMRMLVECLRHCATCEPVFDMEKLLQPDSVIPSRWLIDQIATLPKFIIVISECGSRILDTTESRTHHLVQARPFADLFGPAMEMIIRDATHNLIASKRKYCIVRLPYSPEVPANLAVLNFPVFNLPDQFGQLTAFLHDFENIDQLNISQPLSQSRMTSFREAVRLQMTFFEQNPDWLYTRWRPIDEPAIPQIREQRLPVEISTDEDRIAAAKLYGIDPPRADSEDEETGVGPSNERQFMLHPPANEPDTDTDNDDLSTSEDEIDDEDEEGGEMHTVVFRPDNLF